jgi:CHAT domain-containing protein
VTPDGGCLRVPVCLWSRPVSVRVRSLLCAVLFLLACRPPAAGAGPVATREQGTTLDASLRALHDCRASYAGADAHVPGRCYGDALITLLARSPDAFRPRQAEALAAFVEASPTLTADTAARYRLLWQAVPTGARVMRSLSAAQAEVSQAVYAMQWAAARAHGGSTALTSLMATGSIARGGPPLPLWVEDYVRADDAVLRAFGWAGDQRMLPNYNVRDDVDPRAVAPLAVDLAAAGARYQRWERQPVTLDDLFKALPPDSVYIDFVDYRSLATVDAAHFDSAGYDLWRPQGEPRYFAFAAWKEGAAVRVSAADVGSVASVDAQVEALRGRITQVAPLGDLPRQLYQVLLGPFDGAVQGARQLVLSTAGTLNVLPFEVLQRDGGAYLNDRVVVLYGNIRDVLGDALMGSWQQPQPTSPGLIFADPAYGGDAPAPEGPDACGVGKQRGLQLVGPRFPPRFPRLPCTRAEVDAVAGQSPPGIEVLTGVAATETALRRRERPEFLHFATHGFLLEPPAVAGPSGQGKLTFEDLHDAPIQTRLLVDPLAAAGIALAGANGVSDEPQGRAVADDGLLSAAEVQRLNLGGTRLVVMSACETGQGVVGAGNAFYGLRHAFRSAGAAAVVGSLWSVNDVTTSWFMSAFYAHFFAGDAPAVALQRARREVQQKCPECAHPYYWAPFIMEGAAAALTARRSPR